MVKLRVTGIKVNSIDFIVSIQIFKFTKKEKFTKIYFRRVYKMTLATAAAVDSAETITPRKELSTKLEGLVVEKSKSDSLLKEKLEKAAVEDEEPLLTPNPNRFVLFPIKFHEVSNNIQSFTISHNHIFIVIGLANVQEG